MTESTLSTLPRLRMPTLTSPDPEAPDNRYAEAALAHHKREGMNLAVRSRIAAMAVTAVFISFIAPWPEVLYYHALIVVFVLIGLAQQRIGRVGKSRAELVLLFADLSLMTVVCIVPNPFDDRIWPLPFQYQFDSFMFFYVILASATLAYSWRTIFAVGTWTAGLWAFGALMMSYFAEERGDLRDQVEAAFGWEPTLVHFLDPTNIQRDQRTQEVIVFVIVAFTLAFSVRRMNLLVLNQAEVERERANLARYFSPNVVDELSQNDEPLKQVRSQDVAVLFVDIVGFTRFAAGRSPEEVITTLREFHARMEACVFEHNGTLDKYLGDGLMATFGTPLPGPNDANNALSAARDMADVVDRWNETRAAAGEPQIHASFGIHYGPVVVGDIGVNRLEFAVIGNTVNIASRLEAMTREMSVRLIISDALRSQVYETTGERSVLLRGFERHDGCQIRGMSDPVTLWAFA